MRTAPAPGSSASSVPPLPPPPSATAGGVMSCDSDAKLCRYGADCYNHDPEHRAKFVHPPKQRQTTGYRIRACRYGSECYQRSTGHLTQFAHPGDRNYRNGLVIFENQLTPEFHSLWQLFQFHDPDESGHLSKEEFAEALTQCRNLAPDEAADLSEDEAWEAVGGKLHDHVNFRQFAYWLQNSLRIDLPVGLEVSGSNRPCRFRMMRADGRRCCCAEYEEQEGQSVCVCGHKLSMHRSDFAERSVSKLMEDTVPSDWAPGQEGLVKVEDDVLLQGLQALMMSTHKTTDNWTRDRGCSMHGVNGCPAACASLHRCSVPSGYVLVTAYRNQNLDLWQKFSLVKSAIVEECSRACETPYAAYSVASSTSSLSRQQSLEENCNEWYLFHGTKPEACKGICETNFRLNMAGTGATWKDTGKAVGTPLYGFGLYFAERLTKADEYSQPIPSGGTLLQDVEGEDLYGVLLCRVIGGRANLVTTNEIEIERLRRDVFDGPYHSVFGDRVSSLGKPFREIVVYDKDQCYPEFLLVYARSYG